MNEREMVVEYEVPVDPMDDLQCESCQRAGVVGGRAAARRRRGRSCASTAGLMRKMA